LPFWTNASFLPFQYIGLNRVIDAMVQALRAG
jgi:hypothetical protein